MILALINKEFGTHDGDVHTQETGSSKEFPLALFLEAKSNDFLRALYSQQ